MAEVISMPRLSDTMTEGKVAKWNFNVGDAIKEGDIIAEIETDKAVQDFESEFDGVLLYQGVGANEAAPVDSILAIIGEKGEDITPLLENAAQVENPEETAKDVTASAKAEQTMMNLAEEDMIVPSAVNIPKDVHIITMPRLSDTMEEGKVMKWNFNDGDEVKEGDILAEIETDKAVQDFETEYNGTLLYQGVKEGNTAKVDSILAIIGPKDTDVTQIIENYSAGDNVEKVPVPEPKSPTPKTQNTELKKEVPKTVSQNKTAKKAVSQKAERIFASPLAKKLAEEKGIALHNVNGSGEHGRIVKADIENFIPGATAMGISGIAATPKADSSTPNSQVRNIIAKRLGESKFTAPHYYLTISLDMDPAIAARASINTFPDTKISFNDMIIKACALALREHPQVNSSWEDDQIIHHGAINIGMAVAIPDGLVVPVLDNADFMSLPQISATSKDLAKRARDRKLNADEMEGSTFSISNLGMLGIESFTSIINQPNSAILSIGTIEAKPVIKNGEIVPGNEMKVTMACDHRVIDGATGAEFLQTFKDYMENPIKMVMV